MGYKMNKIKLIPISASILLGVVLFFYNININEMNGFKGITLYIMLFFVITGIKSSILSVIKIMAATYDEK